MKLTAKQEKFCQGVADGLSQADAYRAAYDASKMKPQTLWVKAAELMASGNVAVRVDELRAALAEKAMWTREKSVKTLVDIINTGDAKAGDKINAVKELNSMHGFEAPKKHQVTGEDGKPIQFERIERVVIDR